MIRLFVLKREKTIGRLLKLYGEHSGKLMQLEGTGEFEFEGISYESVMKNRQQQIQIKKHLKESSYGHFENYVGEYNRETLSREGVGLQLEQESLYIGHFLKNRRHGKGRVLTKTYFFQGYFSGDVAQGQGVYHTGQMRY